jgi:hypothetical protein
VSDAPAPLDTPSAPLPALDVSADLRMHVTAPTGETTGVHVTGSGNELHVEAEKPAVLFSAVAPDDVGRVAELLAAAGLVVRVTGPDGPVAVVGAGVSNRVGRAVTGSARVAPAPRAAARIAASTREFRTVAAGLLAVLVAVAGWITTRRR